MSREEARKQAQAAAQAAADAARNDPDDVTLAQAASEAWDRYWDLLELVF